MGRGEPIKSVWIIGLTGILVSSCFINNFSACGVLMKELEILDKLLSSSYDRRATPTNHLNTTTPTRVFCELFVRSFGSPNPLTMDYKVDLYLRQKWRDERLQHADLRQPLDLNDPNLVKAIWKPEVYFPNGKEADFQFVTVPNVLVRINPKGEILYILRILNSLTKIVYSGGGLLAGQCITHSQVFLYRCTIGQLNRIAEKMNDGTFTRLRVTFSCMMDLSKFPLDKQKCTMEVASFSKTLDELILEWPRENPVTVANDLGMSQFGLDKIDAEKCPTTAESFGQIGNYSCIVATFHLSRSLGFHLVQSYLPTILMVFISWVSFWMDLNSVPGRVTLGITTLLTVSHKSTNIQENLPQSSYVKAIDVWMGTCTAFVFLALLEFTVVNYLWRKENHRQNYKRPRSGSRNPEARNQMEVEGYDHTPSIGNTVVQMREKHNSSNHLEAKFVRSGPPPPQRSRPNSLLGKECSLETTLLYFPIRASTIDETCRFAFPLAFCCFNLIYWPFYLFT